MRASLVEQQPLIPGAEGPQSPPRLEEGAINEPGSSPRLASPVRRRCHDHPNPWPTQSSLSESCRLQVLVRPAGMRESIDEFTVRTKTQNFFIRNLINDFRKHRI